jgi:DNA invertase Pin-like site-specific DNA recombinase
MARTRTTPRPSTPIAVIYCRVSTQAQATDGVGLEAQEAVCRAHAARLGMRVLAVHRDEGLSGKDAVEDRPGLAAAIADVQAHPGAVLVAYSVSRVARRQRVLWSILDDRDGLGIPLSSATEAFDTSTPMGRAMLGMVAVWSQLEADMVSERTKDALAALKARGVRLGAPPCPPELRERVRLVAASMPGASARAIAAELNARGITPARARSWKPWSVRHVLDDGAAE